MALSAAMVLSGLQCEHFSEDTQQVFNFGVNLLKSPSTSPLKSTDTTLTKDNGSSSLPFPKKLEVILELISQVEGKSLFARDNPFKSPVEEIENCCKGLFTVAEEVESSSSSTVAEEVESDGSSTVVEEVESDGSSTVAEEVESDGSSTVVEEVEANSSSTISEEVEGDSSSSDVVKVENKIMYENRNILNLAENLTTGWSFQYSTVTCESSDRSEDGSEIHPINEEPEVPRYLLVTCNKYDCSFLEPRFF